jgi:hypothetical protein
VQFAQVVDGGVELPLAAAALEVAHAKAVGALPVFHLPEHGFDRCPALAVEGAAASNRFSADRAFRSRTIRIFLCFIPGVNHTSTPGFKCQLRNTRGQQIPACWAGAFPSAPASTAASLMVRRQSRSTKPGRSGFSNPLRRKSGF